MLLPDFFLFQFVLELFSLCDFLPCSHFLPRMGFHVTDATCYLTADLFYLEVVLLPGGGVEEVKVAPHGGSPVVSAIANITFTPL